jgi:alpha-soluble NSF attachment protein
MLKVGSLAGELGRYEDAVNKFEMVASRCVDNKLTKWSMKEYFLKAGICLLCLGVRSVIFFLIARVRV